MSAITPHLTELRDGLAALAATAAYMDGRDDDADGLTPTTAAERATLAAGAERVAAAVDAILSAAGHVAEEAPEAPAVVEEAAPAAAEATTA